MSQLKSFSPSWKISQGLFLSSIFYSVVLFPLLSPVPPPYDVLLIRFRIFRKVCIKKKHKAPDSSGGLEPWPLTHSLPWHLGHAPPKQRSFVGALYWMCAQGPAAKSQGWGEGESPAEVQRQDRWGWQLPVLSCSSYFPTWWACRHTGTYFRWLRATQAFVFCGKPTPALPSSHVNRL